VWVIGFTDGDGDIGFGEGERTDETNFKTNIYLIESGIVDTSFAGTGFRIPKIEGVETKNGLEGEIRIEIQLNLFKIAPFPVDSIYYDGYLVDRGGNKSNLIQTRIFTVN
jgi:hypothetical protein